MVDEKKDQIIKASLRRFSHFGIAKTSMSEIAEDLKLSKANLYYYFPDKFSLIEAIAEQLVAESDVVVERLFASVPETLPMLLRMLEVKKDYLDRYYMLFIDLHELNISDERWMALANRMFQREIETIMQIFQRGLDQGELVTFDVKSTSELYVSMMRGLAMFCGHAAPTTLMSREDMAIVVEKQKQAAAIFINGVKKTIAEIK